MMYLTMFPRFTAFRSALLLATLAVTFVVAAAGCTQVNRAADSEATAIITHSEVANLSLRPVPDNCPSTNRTDSVDVLFDGAFGDKKVLISLETSKQLEVFLGEDQLLSTPFNENLKNDPVVIQAIKIHLRPAIVADLLSHLPDLIRGLTTRSPEMTIFVRSLLLKGSIPIDGVIPPFGRYRGSMSLTDNGKLLLQAWLSEGVR